MLYFFIFVLLFAGLFLVIDTLQRILQVKVNFSRKATHLASGVIICFMPYFLTGYQIIAQAVLFMVFLLLSKKLNILTLHKVKRTSYGEVLYPAGVILAALLSLPEHPVFFQVSILVLAFSDGLAAMFGHFVPIKTYTVFKGHKSVGGSLSFFAITMLIFVLIFRSSENFGIMMLIALILTGIEGVLTYGTDNIILPPATILFLHLFIA